MQSWLSDLWSRLFTHYQSTVTGLVMLVFTWATDHGIDISQDNQKVATAKILAIALSLFKLFGKDAPTETTPPTGLSGGTGLGTAGKVWPLALVLVFTFPLMACGNTATLDKVGRVAVLLAKGFSDEVVALKAAGVPADRLKKAEDAATKFTAAADSLDRILSNAKTIDGKDASAVAGYVATITAEIGGLLQNPQFLGLGEGSKLVKTARYTSVALNQLSLTLAVFFPPAPPGQTGVASVAESKSVPVGKVKVDFPEPPAEVRALLKR